jgi:hypothetical protein
VKAKRSMSGSIAQTGARGRAVRCGTPGCP